MGHVVAVVSQKGGVGKTTIAVNVAGELVALGYDVLLVDADPQESADVWAARGDGSGWPTVIKHTQPTLNKPNQIPTLKAAYDVVIIDAPGKLDKITNSVLLCADIALIPLAPSALDLEAAAATVELITNAQVINDGLQACYVLSKVQSGTIQAREMVELLQMEPLNVFPLLDVQITQRIKLMECPNGGHMICQLEPGGKAHQEINELTAELLAMMGYHADEDDADE